jgi:hypothetical protein
MPRIKIDNDYKTIPNGMVKIIFEKYPINEVR